MEKNKGISMIELVIVIIIMILIASFAIFSGINSIQKAEATELYAEMSNLMKAVNGVMVQRELERGGSDWIVKNGYCESGDNGTNGWFTVYGVGDSHYEESNLRKKLDMDTIKRNYMVNYDTGEVVLSTPIEIFGNSIRTYDSLRALVESDKI
ncbi:MAG: hypothetical protein IJ220_06900 [Clostridia bacterium]|nr:hypothetical protein [Clostridia bacterium]